MKFVFVTKYREGFEKANTRVEKMTAMHASNHCAQICTPECRRWLQYMHLTMGLTYCAQMHTRVEMAAMHASNHRTHTLCTDLHTRVQKMVAMHASDNGLTLCTELHINMKEIL